ncbi:MAG: hypothetical protein AAF721_31405 [Myxococcota bacterium]
MRRSIKILAGVLGLAVAGTGLAAYRVLRADDIPETLEVPKDPAQLSIPGIGDQPPLAVAELRGETLFFVFVGVRSFREKEGQMINRALNRWTLPPDTRGFIVFDAEGFGFLREKSAEYMERFGKETRFPMYGDFEGAFRDVFKLPRGHHGLVIVDAEGALAMRHSGGLQTEDELSKVRTLLGAEEPPAGPDVPNFEGHGLSAQRCAVTPCVLLFVGGSVARGDIPWIDNGFEGDDQAKWAQANKPPIRNVSIAKGMPLGAAAAGLVVGRVQDVEFPAGWSQIEAAPELRDTFDVGPDETTMVVLREGKVAFRSDGVIPFYELGRLSDLLGVEFDSDD